MTEKDLRQLFKNSSNCYAASDDVVLAIDEDTFIDIIGTIELTVPIEYLKNKLTPLKSLIAVLDNNLHLINQKQGVDKIVKGEIENCRHFIEDFSYFKEKGEKTHYIVRYYGGIWEEEFEETIFITDNKKTASDYVERFNRILKKWTEFYKQFIDNETGDLKSEEGVDHYLRWYSLQKIAECYYEEISFRQ